MPISYLSAGQMSRLSTTIIQGLSTSQIASLEIGGTR